MARKNVKVPDNWRVIYLTVAQAALISGFTEQAFYMMFHRGAGPVCHRPLGMQSIRIHGRSLEAWIEGTTPPETAGEQVPGSR